MDKEVVEKGTDLIRQYQGRKGKRGKKKIRNEIFLLVRPFLLKCIKRKLGKRGIWKEETEILSMSWDVFIYCLERYKEGYRLPAHIHIYSEFYLISHFHSENRNRMTYVEEFEKEPPNMSSDHVRNLISEYLSLRQFYLLVEKNLGDDYAKIFQDALCSMTPACFHRVNREKEIGVNHYRYVEAKKVFRQVIIFLLAKE